MPKSQAHLLFSLDPSTLGILEPCFQFIVSFHFQVKTVSPCIGTGFIVDR